MKGFFITFEGVEGSGKSTQINLLAEKLKKIGKEVVLTREPGGTNLGEKIRDLLLDPNNIDMDDRAEILLYAADRAQHVKKKIIPALKEGKIVLTDRYFDSNIAYQGYGRKLEMKMVRKINEWVIRDVWPDLTILLDIDAKIGLERARNLTSDKKGDRLEQEIITFYENVRSGYLDLAKQEDRFVTINGEQKADKINSDIFKIVKERLL
ncbi:MAG: dTMP kinase [Bacillota bacterium]